VKRNIGNAKENNQCYVVYTLKYDIYITRHELRKKYGYKGTGKPLQLSGVDGSGFKAGVRKGG
jgi:hypothetical protein